MLKKQNKNKKNKKIREKKEKEKKLSPFKMADRVEMATTHLSSRPAESLVVSPLRI